MSLSTETTGRSERNPDLTRRRILEAAFQQMYRRGYQGMRLDDVVAATGLTKGALYHHFPSKQALGYAVVDEVIGATVEELWLRPLRGAADPIEAITAALQTFWDSLDADVIKLGCPLNNLAQEMSPLDEGFRERLTRLYDAWRQGLREALADGKSRGLVRGDVHEECVADFIIAAVEGCIGVAKNAQDLELLSRCGLTLLDYLQTLRAAPGTVRTH